MVGEYGPFVAQCGRRAAHGLDGAAAVGPLRVQVAVPAQGRPQGEGGGRRGRTPGVRRDLVLQLLQVLRDLPVQGLPHHPGGFRPDALDGLQRARRHPLGHLLLAHADERVGRLAEGLHPVGGRLPALQQEGDPLQRRDRVHGAPPRASVTGQPQGRLGRVIRFVYRAINGGRVPGKGALSLGFPLIQFLSVEGNLSCLAPCG